jgi:uncharacterized membrane protein YukC
MAEKAEKVKEAKPKAITMVDVIRAEASKGGKSREDIVKHALSVFAKRGITTVKNGKIKVEEKNVASLLNAMTRDIKAEKGKDTDSWWSKYDVIESETEFKFRVKA